MSDGFMAEPIRPNENSSNNTQSVMQSSSKSNTGIIVLVVILLIFAVPVLFFFKIFGTVWNDIRDDVSEAIRNESGNAFLHQNDYELTAAEQKSVSRLWSNIYTAKDNKNISIHRGDCRALKNIATNFANQNEKAPRWYDTTYCDTSNISTDIEIVTEDKSIAGNTFRIKVRDSEKPSACVLLDFIENFQYLTHVSTFATCSTSTLPMKADDYKEPEVEPLYDEDQKDADYGSDDDIENVPIQKS